CINTARDRVARQFDALLSGATDAQRPGDEAGADWLASDNARIEDELQNSGFPQGEIAAVAATLQAYRNEASYRRLDEAGRRRLHVILGRLLSAGRPPP